MAANGGVLRQWLDAAYGAFLRLLDGFYQRNRQADEEAAEEDSALDTSTGIVLYDSTPNPRKALGLHPEAARATFDLLQLASDPTTLLSDPAPSLAAFDSEDGSASSVHLSCSSSARLSRPSSAQDLHASFAHFDFGFDEEDDLVTPLPNVYAHAPANNALPSQQAQHENGSAASSRPPPPVSQTARPDDDDDAGSIYLTPRHLYRNGQAVDTGQPRRLIGEKGVRTPKRRHPVAR